MGLTGVLRPGHAQIRLLDLDQGIHFYRDVLGLRETGRDRQGRVYLKAWDERDHHCVILRQSDRAGIDFLGFKVLDKETLDRLDADLRNFGVPTERLPANELLETGERVRFEVPSGHQIELYAEKTLVGNGLTDINPAPWSLEAERAIAPVRLDHALLYGPDIEKVQRIFTEVLGFRLTEYFTLEDGKTVGGVFMSCSHKSHDIAFGRYPEPGKLHHLSFMLDSWEKVLRAADLMSMHKVPIDMGPTRHGVTRGATIYAWDPSGNRFETFCGGAQPYPDWPAIHWTWEGMLDGGLDYLQRKLHENFLTIVS